MKTSSVAVLVAAILCLVLGATCVFHVSAGVVLNFASIALFGLFGAVTVTYKYPVSGTTPPTAALMLTRNEINAQVNLLDADTVVTITHNWGLPASDVAGLFPLVTVNPNADSTGTVVPYWTVNNANTNAIVLNKPTTVGTQGTYNILILRPTTLAR